MPRLPDVLRSMAFYAAFYGGTVLLVFVALAVMPLGGNRYREVVRVWSTWHRTCV